jgi:hypothetical protein
MVESLVPVCPRTLRQHLQTLVLQILYCRQGLTLVL